MPGSFDNLTITNGHLSPSGPLQVPPGETDAVVYAWVMQQQAQGAGAFVQCLGKSNAQGDAWVTTDHGVHRGSFEPGQAFAQGTLTAKNSAGKTTLYWWSETILLT